MSVSDYLTVSRIAFKLLNGDNITPYRQCKHQILIGSLSGKTEANCTSKLNQEEIDTLRGEGFQVFPIYLPWFVDDPFNAVKMYNVVKWSK